MDTRDKMLHQSVPSFGHEVIDKVKDVLQGKLFKFVCNYVRWFLNPAPTYEERQADLSDI